MSLYDWIFVPSVQTAECPIAPFYKRVINDTLPISNKKLSVCDFKSTLQKHAGMRWSNFILLFTSVLNTFT